jgi:hypothetical protein
MSFRQTYKGIFQFKDQATLVRAMAENQSEAMGADSMGLQESFHSEGVMLLNIDAMAKAQDWEEMDVAMATLAMHASHGFLYAVAFDGKDGQKTTVEYYLASNGQRRPLPPNSDTAPATSEDYFPMVEDATYDYVAKGTQRDKVRFVVKSLEVNGQQYFYVYDEGGHGLHYNEALDSAFFLKDRSQLFTVTAGNEKDLHSIRPDDPRAYQLVYNNLAEEGDITYAIWTEGDYFSVYTRLENVDLDLAAGKFKDCMKIKVDTYHVEEEGMRHLVHHQYFAKGVGLVKYEKGDAVLELSSYHIPS